MTNPSSAIKPQIDDEYRWNILKKKAEEVLVGRAFGLFREHGIEPILIKGLAAGRNYPESRTRLSIDIDLAVAAADFERGGVIARSPDANGLAIDLHRELRHLDTLDWDDLFENSNLIEIDGGTIRVLRPEDHLRVLCIHWLTDGGSNMDRLWDIYYAVENRPADFDWARFLDSVSPRRRRWLICTVGLASRFLGLDLSETPINEEAHDLPAWLVKTVEKEWAREEKPWPLEASLKDPGLFLKQFKNRLRPNPIYATVDMDGSFDARTRVFYQIGNFIHRILPSYKRVTEMMRSHSRSRSEFKL